VNAKDVAAILREWAREVRERARLRGIPQSELARFQRYVDEFDNQGAVIAHEGELQAIATERNASAVESIHAADELWREPRSFTDDPTQPAGRVADDTTVPMDPPHKPRRH
jgi:hypothetical protein